MSDHHPTIVDPRVLAASLNIETSDLAGLFAGWTREKLEYCRQGIDFDRRSGPITLDEFDERVAAARRQYQAALEAYAAWDPDEE